MSSAASLHRALKKRISHYVEIGALTAAEERRCRRSPETALQRIEERLADARSGLAVLRRRQGTQVRGRISDSEAWAFWLLTNVRSACARAVSERFGLGVARQLDLFGDAPERRGRPGRAGKKGGGQ